MGSCGSEIEKKRRKIWQTNHHPIQDMKSHPRGILDRLISTTPSTARVRTKSYSRSCAAPVCSSQDVWTNPNKHAVPQLRAQVTTATFEEVGVIAWIASGVMCALALLARGLDNHRSLVLHVHSPLHGQSQGRPS